MTALSTHEALIVVDVQNDFAHPDGSLFVQGAPLVMSFINEAIRNAEEDGAIVVRTQDWHPAVTPHFASSGGLWPDHCIGGTWGAEFHNDLIASGPVVRKGVDGEDGYSGFTIRNTDTGLESSTELESILRTAGVSAVSVVGLATDYCVAATVIDSAKLGFDTAVLADGISPVNLSAGDGSRAIAAMLEAGAVVR